MYNYINHYQNNNTNTVLATTIPHLIEKTCVMKHSVICEGVSGPSVDVLISYSQDSIRSYTTVQLVPQPRTCLHDVMKCHKYVNNNSRESKT